MTGSITGSPRTTRPGGRTARVRDDVLQATRDLLVHEGTSEMRMERIAERSGVHRSTLYRRWKRPSNIVADLANEIAGTLHTPNSGDLRGDLYQLAEQLATQLNSGGAPLIRALLGWNNLEVQHHLEQFWHDRQTDVAHVLQCHKIDLDPALVARLLAGPLHYRSIIERQPVDEPTITAVVESTIRALSEHLWISEK